MVPYLFNITPVFGTNKQEAGPGHDITHHVQKQIMPEHYVIDTVS